MEDHNNEKRPRQQGRRHPHGGHLDHAAHHRWNKVFTRSNRSAISRTTIISTTTSPARVVIMACSSRPARLST